jgi:prepilin-type N-terminal cleavage/methylation domain-containing protein
MKKILSSLAFTLIELLVVISIIAILASLAIPAITSALVQGQLTQTLSNAKQIHLATFNMSNDSLTTGDQTIGWPGDLSGTNAIQTTRQFVQLLVNGDYLKAGDLKIFAAQGIQPFVPAVTGGTDVTNFSGANNNAFKIFYVTSQSDSGTIFLETKNFTYGGAQPLSPGVAPYGDKGFVVFHKGGDGSKYKKGQATQTNLLGQLISGTADGVIPTQETAQMYLQNQ